MALREVLANFEIRVDDRQLQKANGAIDASVGKLGQLAGLFAGALSVGAIAAFVKGQIDFGDAVAKSATRLGLSVSELEAWNFAADRSGVSSEQLEGSLLKLGRNAFNAANGSKESAAAFRRFGISTKDANGNLRPTTALLPEIADALKGIESSTERAATAQLFFGKSGAALIPLLNEGSEGMAALTAKAAELGGGLSNEFGKEAEAANDALGDVNFALTGLKSKIALAVLPAVTGLANGLASLIGMVQKNQAAMTVIKGILITLGIVLTVLAVQWLAAFAVPIAIGILVAAGLVAIILLVDDLIAMFRGERSVIAAFIDEMFGFGTAAEIVQYLTDVWTMFVGGLEQTPQVLDAAWDSIVSGILRVITFFGDLWEASEFVGARMFDALTYPFAQLEKYLDRARNGLGGLLKSLGIDAPQFAAIGESDRTVGRGLGAALAPRPTLSSTPNFGGGTPAASPGAPVSVTINARTGASAEEIAAHAARALQAQNENAARDFRRARAK